MSRRYIYFIILVICLITTQQVFQLNTVFSMVMMTICFLILWRYYDYEEEIKMCKENKELQERVRSSAKDAHLKNKQLLTVVSSIPFPLILLDQFGNITMTSNIDEISDGEADSNMTFIKNNFLLPVQEFIKDCFIMERSFDRILHLHNIEYQSICVPITTKGKFSGCLLLFQNVSKTLEGEKMQKRFVADASHELKTPIAIIKGMVEILNRDDFDDVITQKEFLQQIDLEINRLDLLVKDLLVLSRLSLSNVLLTKESVDLTQVIDRAVFSFQKQLQEKDLHIKVDYQYKSLVRCDENKMSQVILNLLSNAIKYSDSGTICITTINEKGFYTIRVVDEGKGIAKDDLTKIFDRFYRVNDDRCRKTGGSGLGLSIVKSIIDAHNGKIEVMSELNKGTTFIVKIPL